jgi:uncharacterized repeat protein (TIGR03803 family)
MSLSAEVLCALFLASAATIIALRFAYPSLRTSSRYLTRALCPLAVLLVVFIPWKAPAQQYTQSVLYNFCPHSGCADGAAPSGTPILDAHGNLYGVAGIGGANNKGVVYELTRSGGTWTESVLYSFCQQSNCSDGSQPYYALAFDSQGNLYGTTVNGGSNSGGVVYKLTPPPGGSGPWTESVLYNICQVTCQDGSGFIGGLVVDSHGNVYGAADGGGSHGGGLIFELSPNGGSWTYSVLYNFCTLTNCADGSGPSGGLIFDVHGNLYGPTASGGVNEAGTVFELSPNGANWSESVLYSFCPALGCPDGNEPQFALVFDPQGNLYGAVNGGGANAYGGIFELSPSGGGSWTEQVLQSFCPGPTCTNGYGPKGVAADAHNNVFGDTAFGGGQANRGNVFELSPLGGGHWNYNVIYTFCPQQNCNNDGGGEPLAGIVLDGQGNIYGTTGAGGLYSEGAVYELMPVPLIPTTTVLTTAPNPSNLGQAVTMTATVHAQNGSTPTGTVVFQSNGTQIGSASLNNSGVAVLNYANLPVGNDNIVAIYQGSATLAPSTSNTVQQVVQRDLSTTAVTSSPNPSTGGEQVTITATVTPAGSPAPTGTVGFTSNGTLIPGCSAQVLSLSGIASCTTSSLAVGTDAIVATYSGDGNYAGSNGSVTQIVNPVPEALQFVTLTPCRVVDTRNPNGTFGGPAIPGNTARAFPLTEGDNPCGIPANAVAYSLNVTVVPITHLSYLTIWPTGEGQPTVSTLNSPDGRIKANAVIIPAGTSSGSVSVFVTNTTNVLLDIDGYFIPSSGQTLAFYPLTPCRVADTRSPNGPLGGPYLHAGVERDFPVQSSNCQIPSSAAAYSLNFTAIPKGSHLGYLTVWPQGSPQPVVSTLNDPTGTVVANAALVPAGNGGAIATYANNDTNLVIDVNGYFAPAGSGGLSFYALTPCRVLDTRSVGNGQPFSGKLIVNVVDSACGPPATSAGYVFNATVVPQGALGFLTLWPDPEQQPVVSTLNAVDGAVTSNMAIVPNSNGKTDAWAQGTTQLILDISGYFAP